MRRATLSLFILAAAAAALPQAASAAPQGVGANRGSCAAADSSCLSSGSRAIASQQQSQQQAPMAAAGCKQGSADSSCAIPSGAARASYAQGLTNSAPTPCHNYGPSIWDGACPPGQLGAIAYRQDYACAWRTVALPSGTLSSAYSEPGSWSGVYQISNSCYTHPPPPPPAPAFSYIYSVSSHWGFCGGSSFGGQTQPILNTISFTTAGTNARDVMGYCEYSFSTPWGVSPQNSFQSMPRAQALSAPMQYLKDRGCSIASEDPAAMDAAIAAERARSLAFGYSPSTVDTAMNMIRANIGIDDWYYSNYAACPSQVR